MKNLDEIKFDEKRRHQAGMTVPEGFFEQFQQQLEAKIDMLESQKESVPVVKMPVHRNWQWGRWAAAACVLVMVGVSLGVMGSLTTEEENTQAKVSKGIMFPQSEQSSEQQSEMEEMMIRSVSDFDLYDYYCEL